MTSSPLLVQSSSPRVETAWILAEIEPYSFESMRNSSDSEGDDVYESQDGHRRGN